LKEEEVYDDLGEWFKDQKSLAWYKVTHLNHFITYTEQKDILEPDICYGTSKGQKFVLTDAIHVKTKDNLRSSGPRFELGGKANHSLKGVRRVWIAIEDSSYWIIEGGLKDEVGIITYKEKNGKALNFQIKKEAQENPKPKYEKETQELFNEKFGKEMKTLQSYYICSMERENWPTCKTERLWGVPKGNPAEIIIQKMKLGDIILFRLNKGKGKPKGKFGFVGLYMVVSEPFEDPSGGPWKKDVSSETRDFNWQVKTHPFLVEEFENVIELNYEKGMDPETGLTYKAYSSGTLKIKDIVYKIISKKLIESNQKQLERKSI